MGIEPQNESFQTAASAARAVHDGATDGSPIGAAAAEVSENATQDDSATEQTFGPGPSLPPFLGMLFGSIMAAEQAAAEEAEAAEIVEDATDFYAVAQKLTAMSNGAESFADSLELNGMGDVAEFVREAASKVRKGAKLARSNARETLVVLVPDDAE
ncbi:MAG TPA: hypothetical protein H9899_07405 [Candidatus Sphingomonas excrementigallinarum]|nr:hypothetical protein [Candidatus Sphingomonas excrementigallinarum]